MIFFRTICALVMLSVCASGVYGMRPMQIAKEKQNAKLTQKEKCIQKMKDWVDDNRDRLRSMVSEKSKFDKASDITFCGMYIVTLCGEIETKIIDAENFKENLIDEYCNYLHNSGYIERMENYRFIGNIYFIDRERRKLMEKSEKEYKKNSKKVLDEIEALKEEVVILGKYNEDCFTSFLRTALQNGVFPDSNQCNEYENVKQYLEEQLPYINTLISNFKTNAKEGLFQEKNQLLYDLLKDAIKDKFKK